MNRTEPGKLKSGASHRAEVVAWMQEVSRYFGGPRLVRALTEVSFEVRRGEVFGLVGPSGSGKSTAMRILAGRLSPSQGKARVFGCPPRRSSVKRRVGYLPQSLSHNEARPFSRAKTLLRELFALGQRRQHPGSGDAVRGSQRRHLLKQLVSKDRELLLLDAPFSALEAAGSAEMSDLIAASAKRGKTIVLTSDSLTHVQCLCDRIAIFYDGKIESIGTIDEILSSANAVRFTGPVLPPETATRVLQIIRDDLGRRASLATNSVVQQQGKPALAPSAAVTKAPAAETALEQVLAPLVGGPKNPRASEIQQQTASPVDTERLALLTRPAPTPAAPGPAHTE